MAQNCAYCHGASTYTMFDGFGCYVCSAQTSSTGELLRPGDDAAIAAHKA